MFDLNEPVFHIGKEKVPWTIANSVEGLQIFGGIGSGKSSGSGRFFALKYLSKGYGGLVLTVKPDEKDEWVKYCKIANRENDLIIVEPNGRQYFNFLEYESSHAGNKNYTDNILQVLKTVIRASEEKSSGKGDDPFWENASDMLISNTIDLCLLAYGKVSIELLYNIARSALKSEFLKDKEEVDSVQNDINAFDKAMVLAIETVHEKIAQWASTLTTEERSKMTEEEQQEAIRQNVPEARTFTAIKEFFFETYAGLNEKTRSIVDFTFTGFLFRFLKEPVYSLFCNKPSTFTPEDCLNGKIIIINLPVKLYHKVGRDAQIMFKYIWQRAMEKRNTAVNGRPVFVFADEAQNFLHEHDAEFQATARSSRIATVYITQNIPNYYASMGGIKGEYKVKSFLGTLASKIFHANADVETNKYASDLIGEHYNDNITESTNTVDGKVSITKTISLQLMKYVRPETFQTLQTGGKRNEQKVSGYIHIQGLIINPPHPEKQSHQKLIFNQEYIL